MHSIDDCIHTLIMEKIILIFFSILYLIPCTSAQNIVVSELATQHQLPKEIKCIFQDSEGYMWYGTNGGGLCRDDGFNIITFRADINTPDIMESNNITCITEDREHHIWFGTNRGAYVLDKKDYSISPIEDEGIKRWVINTINVFSDGSIWISTNNNLFRYDSNMKQIANYDSQWQDGPQKSLQLYEDREKNIWQILWRNGIFRYDPKTDKFIPQEWPFEQFPTSIIKDKEQSYYWVSTWGNGIIRYDPSAENFDERYVVQSASIANANIQKKQVLGLEQDHTIGLIWAKTNDNLYTYQITDDNLCPIDNSYFLPKGTKKINAFASDRQGHLWIASAYPNSFTITFPKNKVTRNTLDCIYERYKYPAVSSALAYENDNYWFMQDRSSELCYYHMKEQKISAYHHPHLSTYFTKAKVQKGVYATRDASVLHFYLENDKVSKNMVVALPIKSYEHIRVLHEDIQGNLWIGTNYRLFCYNLHNKKSSIIWNNTGIIQAIISSDDGTIYISTETKTLLTISPDGGKNIYPTNEDFIKFVNTPDGQIWGYTTQGGVYYYNPVKKCFITKTKECELTGDIIADMNADNLGNIWIVTDQKLIIFDPVKQISRSIRCTEPFISLNNFHTIFKDKEGRMHIGGTGGIIVFDADYILKDEKDQNKVLLTSINVENTKKMIGVGARSVKLKPDERNVELFFSTLDPLNTSKTRFAFRYKGQTNWNYIPEGQNSIYLTGLTKGLYELEVRVTDSNGIWKKGCTVFSIYRLPAWYESWWAFSIYIIIICSLIIFIIRKYLDYQKNKQQIKMEKEVASMKYRFFTNISHELRTPLTLVINPLETIIRKIPDSDTRKDLENVRKNAQSLLHLVNQLLDFRKVDTGNESLSLSKGDMTALLASIYENFKLIANEKGLALNYESEVDNLYIYFDGDKIRKIVNNLLSNAIKFTEQGDVSLILRTEIQDGQKYCTIVVKDTGKGIPKNEQTNIFERFRQIKDKNENINNGSGIGLHLVKEYAEIHKGYVTVNSNPSEGAVFSVFIPTNLEPEAEINTSCILEASAQNKKILIVEDNQEFRSYLKKELNDNFIISEAADGKEGLQKAINEAPDIIITDLMMPIMDGIELIHKVKNNIDTSHTPIILLTANDNIDNEKSGYKEGADAYITKPFNREILLLRIDNLLKQKDQRIQTFNNTADISPESITTSLLDEQFIKKALEIIDKNLSNSEYSIEDFSKDLYMSRASVHRKIKSITGSTPTEFIKNIRLKRAAELLKQGLLNVNEVAYTVGFGTPSYFTQSFKKMFGVLPNKYK